MRTLKIEGKTGTSEIVLGESISNLAKYCEGSETVIITDRNVRALHGASFPKAEIIEIGIGEHNKTLKTVEGIYEKFLELGLDRSSCVAGIGGGIVCDVAGFAASTYLRGLKFGFAPTTLLAQVDASIGGKNGVNFKGYKNLVGTFRQPNFVLCDFEMLKTLPPRELRNGFAEIVKHGAIADAQLFSYLEENCKNALAIHRTAIEKIVYDSLMVKSRIVSLDETEKGERRKLNFGHTFGHAIEKTTGLPHGEAISIGMVAAARLSAAKGLLASKEADRIESLLKALGLPVLANATRRR
ncbi:3-dehydroquinate synthase [uncultured archaeon]|nr:3-dehydroquinate synthase [uncultured archaeon]